MTQCPACGMTIEAGNRFCASCGAPLPAAITDRIAGSLPWYRTGTGVLGIGMTLAAVAVVAVVLIVSQGDDEAATAGPTPTVAAPSVPGPGITTPSTEPSTTTTSASTEPTTTTATTFPTTTTTASGFSREFRDAFMDGCVGGGNRPFCRCTLNAFEERYPQDDLVAILAGDRPPPDDFSDASIACYAELPTAAPLPGFALPNACTADEWGMVVSYPTGWEANREVRECFSYRPADAPAGSMAVVVGISTTTLDEVLANSPPHDYLEEYPERDVYIWVVDSAEGTAGVEYSFLLWPEMPDGPAVMVIADLTASTDAWTVADMIIKGLEIAPYSP